MLRNLLIPIFGVLLTFSCSDSPEKVNSKSSFKPEVQKEFGYKTKEYGGRLWMTENLRESAGKEGQKVKFYIPNDDSRLVKDYGYLYDFETACTVCPEGWHLPSLKEWQALWGSIGEQEGRVSKDALCWKEDSAKGQNESGFSIRPAGFGNNGEFENKFGRSAYFWTSSRDEEHDVLVFAIESNSDSARLAPQHATYGFSVRCLQDLK